MPKEIRINAFNMNCVGHQCPGLWRHPRDRASEYTSLAYWQELAKTLERGKFDGIFLADVTGVYDVYGGSPDAALKVGLQVPVNDPFLVVPAMAAVTEHLGFGVTASISTEPPYTFARRMSTLDHLTQGRAGWNIVTGYLNSSAKGSGQAKQKSHDLRYEIAAEYMDIMYQLWEGSWEDDAVRRDKAAGIFTDPSKVHAVRHDGEYFRVEGIHLSEPSPQRTPVLYQAGTSSKGLEFAGRHAECVFIGGPTKEMLANAVRKIRQAAVAQGRNPADIQVFAMMTVVAAPTDAQAREKVEEYRRHISTEGALALLSGFTGVDFSAFDPAEPVKHIRNDSIHTAIDRFTVADPSRVWTVGEVAEHMGFGGSGPLVHGSPETVARELQEWVEATDIDGYNLNYTVAHEGINDFVDLVVPALQERGVYKTSYAGGALRNKLFGSGPRLKAPHYGAQFGRNR